MMELTSRQNERVQFIKKLGASKALRDETGVFLCEGYKLLEEALRWRAEVCEVFAAGECPDGLPDSVKVYRVSPALLAYMSTQQTPQGILFTVRKRKSEIASPAGSLVLENMQDPGNIGTILRTANAFGVRNVILVGACADPWGPKAVRAAMGAVFKENIFRLTLDELLEKLRLTGTPLYGAALSDKSMDIRHTRLNGAAVAVGNEGNGLTEAFLAACDGQIIIPMVPECESLNAGAAAAVLLWEMEKGSL